MLSICALPPSLTQANVSLLPFPVDHSYSSQRNPSSSLQLFTRKVCVAFPSFIFFSSSNNILWLQVITRPNGLRCFNIKQRRRLNKVLGDDYVEWWWAKVKTKQVLMVTVCMQVAACCLLILCSGVHLDGGASEGALQDTAAVWWPQAENLDLFPALAGPLHWPDGGPPPGPAAAVFHLHHSQGEQNSKQIGFYIFNTLYNNSFTFTGQQCGNPFQDHNKLLLFLPGGQHERKFESILFAYVT